MILSSRIEQFLGDRLLDLRFVVLSMRNCRNLAEGLEQLWEAWTRFRRSRRWKSKVVGCIVAMEVTRNPEDGSWHPHLNVLFEGDYFPVEELRQAWIKATHGEGQQVWISRADRQTVRELIKYVTKLSDLLRDPDSVDEFLTAIQGVRLLRTYGTFFGLKIEGEQEDDPAGCCPDCGPDVQVHVKRLGPVEPHDLCLDHEGVFRISKRVIPRPETDAVYPRRSLTSARKALDRLFAPFIARSRALNQQSWKEYSGGQN